MDVVARIEKAESELGAFIERRAGQKVEVDDRAEEWFASERLRRLEDKLRRPPESEPLPPEVQELQEHLKNAEREGGGS